jgi:hypothetical protein
MGQVLYSPKGSPKSSSRFTLGWEGSTVVVGVATAAVGVGTVEAVQVLITVDC